MFLLVLCFINNVDNIRRIIIIAIVIIIITKTEREGSPKNH